MLGSWNDKDLQIFYFQKILLISKIVCETWLYIYIATSSSFPCFFSLLFTLCFVDLSCHIAIESSFLSFSLSDYLVGHLFWFLFSFRFWKSDNSFRSTVFLKHLESSYVYQNNIWFFKHVTLAKAINIDQKNWDCHKLTEAKLTLDIFIFLRLANFYQSFI